MHMYRVLNQYDLQFTAKPLYKTHAQNKNVIKKTLYAFIKPFHNLMKPTLQSQIQPYETHENPMQGLIHPMIGIQKTDLSKTSSCFELDGVSTHGKLTLGVIFCSEADLQVENTKILHLESEI